jgi:hypothetical protein
MKSLVGGCCWRHRCEIAETVASSYVSAACYGFAENIFIFPMIEAESEIVQVPRKVVFANVVIAAPHAALEQRPEAFDRVRLDRGRK